MKGLQKSTTKSDVLISLNYCCLAICVLLNVSTDCERMSSVAKCCVSLIILFYWNVYTIGYIIFCMPFVFYCKYVCRTLFYVDRIEEDEINNFLDVTSILPRSSHLQWLIFFDKFCLQFGLFVQMAESLIGQYVVYRLQATFTIVCSTKLGF